MKAKFESNLEYGKKIIKYLIIASIAIMVIALFCTPEGSTVQGLMMLAIIVLLIICFVIIYRYCRCPYCGKHIFFGILRVKVCPACKRNLVNGKKTKKYER